MRARLAAISADRISHVVVLTAGVLFGALALLVGLPLARSSPYPAAREDDWRLAHASPGAAQAPASHARSPSSIRARGTIEWQALTAPMGVFAEPQALIAMRIPDPIWSDDVAPDTEDAPGLDAPARTGRARSPASAKTQAALGDEIDDYLWEVYERVPTKRDSTGDFTWKDQAAAKRVRLSLADYVIRGMDRDFREQLYHAGKAMDAAGVRWSMLSAFRDDWRQQIASGFKAHAGNSLHGGSRATGGFGHGRAVDVISADEKDDSAVWRWFDTHGASYGLRRPMPGVDPAHIQAGGDWHRIAANLREGRVNEAYSLASTNERPARRIHYAAKATHHHHGHKRS